MIELTLTDNVTPLLRDLANLDFVDDVLMAGGVAIKGKVDDYPPSKSRPGRYSLRTHRPMGYYKRGTGWMSPIVRKGRAVRYVNYKATSETLGRKWTITKRGAGVVAVGNNVSYGPWVQSRVRVGNVGPQSRLMRAYGWKTIEDVADAEGSKIVQQMENALRKKLGE